MNLLDSFYMLFEADTSKLDKGLQDADKKANDLEKHLGGVDEAAGKIGGSLIQSLAALAGAAVAGFSVNAMAQAMFQAADAADRLDETAGRLDISIESLSAWGDLVKKSGGSVEGFTASIESLNSQLAQIEVTGKSRAAPFLKELGIDLDDAANKGKTALDFLPQIADAFADMDKTKSMALGKKLGLDPATIMTLQSGRREVEALLAKERELGVVTKEQGEIAAAFNDQLDDTQHAFRSVWLGVTEYVLPPLTWMSKALMEGAVFMRKHSGFVVGLMIALGAAVSYYAIPPLFLMAKATLIAFAPFIAAGVLVAALAAAFALLYEDIMMFIEGGDSMIGAILNRWPIIGEIARSIVWAFKELWAAGETLAEVLARIWDNPTQAFLDFLNFVLDGIKMLAASIPGLSSLLGAMGIELPGNQTQEGIGEGQRAISAAGSTRLASQTSTSISNSQTAARNTQVSIGKVEVQTQATDADGISKAIGGSMQTQMRQAASNFDDGVLA